MRAARPAVVSMLVAALVLGGAGLAWSAAQPVTSSRLGAFRLGPPAFYPAEISTVAASLKAKHGQPSKGDTLTAAFNAQASQPTICSGWSNATSSKSLSLVTLTLLDGTSTNDVLTVSAVPTTCATGFHLGTFDLGSAGFVSGGNATFTGSSITLTQTATSTSVTLTLGTRSGGTTATVSTPVALTWTPDIAVTDTTGHAATPSLARSAALVQF